MQRVHCRDLIVLSLLIGQIFVLNQAGVLLFLVTPFRAKGPPVVQSFAGPDVVNMLSETLGY